MADAPIGISFIPSAQNAAQGAANLSLAGGGGQNSTDLAQAYKVLSLRLPTNVAPTAPVAPALLNSAGAAGVPNLPSGLSPYAALFQALLKSHGFDMPAAASAPDASGFDPSALPGFASVSAAAPPASADPGGMAAGSSLPGAMTPPPDASRPSPRVTFPSAPIDRAPTDWLGGNSNGQDYQNY